MKKIKNKKILYTFLFLFVLISSGKAIAATEYWWFHDSYNVPLGSTYSTSFNSESACKIARDAYIKTVPETLTIGSCYKGQSDGKILVSEVSQNSNINTIYAQKDAPTANTSYKLLAPIGGFKELTTSTNIGGYFNIMIRIAIGLCAVLAVIMIIIGGIQYMGNESIFGKSEAKGQITKAIFGLIIALGSYALLNTISPALLGVNGLNVKSVSAGIEEVPWVKYEQGDNIKACPEGFGDVIVKYGDGTKGEPDKVNLCKTITNKLTWMINAAYRSTPSLKISGSGSRTLSTQESYRASNCGGTANIYNEKAKCDPATAIPGTSNHEKGLAIDITCNGVSPGQTDTTNPCYVWLTKNAAGYGFYNNYKDLKETWHWSTTGD